MMQEDASPPTAASESESESLGSLVGKLAHAFESALSPGDVAALRRLRPEDLPPPAFYRIAARYLEVEGGLPEGGPRRESLEARWVAVLAAMARLSGLHRPRRSLGEALAGAGYHELRFERLLRADSRALPEHLRAASLYLDASGEVCDQADLAALMLTSDPTRAAQLRRRLARTYHRTLSNKTRST
jgi:CRISPR system Cascade subunit CasB